MTGLEFYDINDPDEIQTELDLICTRLQAITKEFCSA